MLFKKKEKVKNEKLDIKNVNQSVSLLKTILRIFIVLLIIVGIFVVIKILKELHVKENLLMILKIILPLFIGFFIAWLFDPFVTFLQKKGIRRTIGTLITYVLLIGAIALILGTLIPTLGNQINDFVKIVPKVFDDVKLWIEGIFDNFDKGNNIDINSIKENLFNQIETFASDLTSSLPEQAFNFIKALVSGIGNFLVGLVIGFFLLINFDNVSDSIITFFPKKAQNDVRDIFNEINTAFRRFINGAIADSTLVFVVSSIAFVITGLKAPLLFGLFCGITNIIPYAGPYIGGAPAVIVGFSQSTSIGIAVLISLIIIQTLEGNFIQPLIMSKSAKLHPVTVIIGLLVFGHFFGIIGMAISTPVIGACKALFLFFDEKYQILNYNKE
jgi:predicted PurR-regulated permease PerM